LLARLLKLRGNREPCARLQVLKWVDACWCSEPNPRCFCSFTQVCVCTSWLAAWRAFLSKFTDCALSDSRLCGAVHYLCALGLKLSTWQRYSLSIKGGDLEARCVNRYLVIGVNVVRWEHKVIKQLSE